MDSPCRATGRELVNEYDEGIEWIGDDKANARLIAAAPDLYETLEMCRRVLAIHSESGTAHASVTDCALIAADAALAKARGE
jgi:hypothetical protein